MNKYIRHLLIFLAGVVLTSGVVLGTLVLLRPYWTSVQTVTIPTIIERERLVPTTQDEALGNVRKKVLPMVLSVYKKRADGYYALSRPEKVALGVTSDGWIVTVGSLAEMVVVLPDATINPVTNIIKDEATGMVFGKINVQNLTAARFSESASLESGEPVYVVAPGYILESTFGGSWFPVESESQSSMLLKRRFLVGTAAGVLGSAVADRNQGIVGIVADPGKGLVIPANHFRFQIKRLLKTGDLAHPSFGAEFTDQFQDLAVAGLSGAVRGALVKSVKKGTAAEQAGLKIGDVIISVEGEKNSADRSLPEILEQFDASTEVEIVYMRSGKEQSARVILSEKK
ncbi:MAG: S1C family serine protease [bacterium]